MVLYVTARDSDGKTLFEDSETWQEIGLDIDGDMRYGAWQIKETIDLALQPLETWKGRYLMHFDTDTAEAQIEVTLRYFLSASQGDVVESFKETVRFETD